MPGWMLGCYLEMHARLEAEEALATISQVAAGTGSMQERDQRQFLRDLRRAANGGREKAVKATKGMLERIGIKVSRVEVVVEPPDTQAEKPGAQTHEPPTPEALAAQRQAWRGGEVG